MDEPLLWELCELTLREDSVPSLWSLFNYLLLLLLLVVVVFGVSDSDARLHTITLCQKANKLFYSVLSC